MTMFIVQKKSIEMFFDRAKVIKAIGKKNARALGRVGRFIRTRARTDILRRPPGSKRRRLHIANGDGRPASRPGRPPFVHSRDSFMTLRNVLYHLNGDWESVIVGPRVVPSRRLKASSAKTVPELMEYGGTARITEVKDGDDWRPIGKKTSADAIYRSRTARYAARPFMGPALKKEAEAGTLIGFWVNPQA